jgi:GDPmannose 4,6-dehydratase
MTKTAFVTGVTGQDGSYLTELLLNKDYRVFGMVRRSSTPNLWRLAPALARYGDRLTLVEGDMTDEASLYRLVREIQPDEVYNLAAMSFVARSFQEPILTADIDAVGPVRLLEALRIGMDKPVRFYQASSSEMFGKVHETPQSETTPFHPRSPYGSAKVMAHYAVQNYRESYGMFAASGICFNHESPRRGEEFVTRKIALAAARISLGKQKKLRLGNLDAQRDWGHAWDYVHAMHHILQLPEPDDYVIATGETHSVREFVAEAFTAVGLGWKDYVTFDKQMLRPADVELLRGDPRKLNATGWRHQCGFHDLVRGMVGSDLHREDATKKDGEL